MYARRSDIRRAFEQLDTDGDGHISWKQLHRALCSLHLSYQPDGGGQSAARAAALRQAMPDRMELSVLPNELDAAAHWGRSIDGLSISASDGGSGVNEPLIIPPKVLTSFINCTVRLHHIHLCVSTSLLHHLLHHHPI